MADDPKQDDDQGPSARPGMGKVLAKASASPVNLGVAGAAAAAAAALGSWPILALGGVAYAAMVAFDAASPKFWKKTFAGGGGGKNAPPRMPRPNEIVDPQTRAAIQHLGAARAELERVLDETSREIRAQLATVEHSLDELEARAARLVVRAEELARYLAKVDPDAVAADVERLAARERGATDAEARKQFAQARAAREEEQRTLDELRRAKERLDANLLRVVATVSGLPSKVVHMRALDAQAMDDLTGNMSAELEILTGEMRTFEETLKTLVEVPGP